MRRFLIVSSLLLAACRDGSQPFEIVHPPADTGRITFSILDDRAPAWGSGNDTIFYSGGSFPPFASTEGMLFGISRRTGIAEPIVKAVQSGVQVQPTFVAPAISADGNKVAFFEITNVIVDPVCDSVSDVTGTPQFMNTGRTTLMQAVLRARRLDALSASEQDSVVINFPGRTIDGTRHPQNLDGVTVQIIYPYQTQYEAFRSPLFRGSWSPDGTRYVFSDGIQLRIWTVGQSTTVAIPNTEDGIYPAWSPDGNTIAFTRLPRGPAQTYGYVCWQAIPRGGYGPVLAVERTIFGAPLGRNAGTLTLIKPDGSGAVARGLGEAPAWTPDSRFVVVHRNAALVKVAVDTGSATDIPDTAGGYEPAISRDGSWLAYSKLFLSAGNHDIWLAPF